MSTLRDAVVARIPNVRLVELTNGRRQNASGIDETVLERACTDAASHFLLYGEIEFDATSAAHIAVAIGGVLAYLREYLGQEEAGPLMKSFEFRLKRVRDTGPRGRMEPYTDSTLEPTDDLRNGEGVARPDGDRSRFRDLVPNPPGFQGDDDRDGFRGE